MENSTQIIIKRYANRKLYDTSRSRYVTLEEISQMVHDGHDVKILDHKSKKDITSITLAQIIFEKEKKQRILPSSTLIDTIRSGGEAISGFIQKTVKFGRLKEDVEKTSETFERLLSSKVISRDEWVKLLHDLYDASFQNLESLQKRVDEKIKSAAGQVSNLGLMRREVDAIKAQVALLEEKIDSLEKTIRENSPE